MAHVIPFPPLMTQESTEWLFSFLWALCSLQQDFLCRRPGSSGPEVGRRGEVRADFQPEV